MAGLIAAKRGRGDTRQLDWNPRARWFITGLGGERPGLKALSMTDTPPDRLASNPKSPHYDQAVLERGVGVRFKGVEKTNVDEYCVSEGWVRLTVGTTVDRNGDAMTIKLQGPVEPYFRDQA
jgi:hypothetical protein